VTGRVSFIIPVRNDARRPARCLASIRRAFSAVGRVEIVVVDNGSVDGSGDVARKFGATVLTIPEGRVAELRNRGAQAATGDVLAFVDADHEIAAGWVAAALDTLRLPGAGAVGALCRAPMDGTWVQKAYGDLRGRPRGRQDVEWLGSGNLAMWRRVFEHLKGFDASLEACEDVDLCARVRAAGFRVISDARLDNVHYGDPQTLRDLFKSELWRGRDNLRVSLRAPWTWRSLPSVLIPIVDMAMLALLPMASVAALFGYPAGLLLFATAALMPIAGSVAKVLRARLADSTLGPARLARALAVAYVYDCARAFALLMRTPHRAAVSQPMVASQ
jgi:glycosyltransferase involved in cell wall biosynthesis